MTNTTTSRPTTPEPARAPDPAGALGTCVARKVTAWQRDYLRRRPEALATLARLRRGVGKEVGAVPELWMYTLDGLPEQQPRRDGSPTVSERAAYTAMTLFAVHQQSRGQEMHQPGQSLGTAVRQLRVRAASADAVRRRFEALGTAETFPEVVHHARGLITQLRSHGIPLDYGRFTEDLVYLQTRGADRVRLRWGRDFYRIPKQSEHIDDDTPAAETAPTQEEAA
jgi:CRISPR system Cascade subunit CasB